MTLRDLALIVIASLLFTAPPPVIRAFVLGQGVGPGCCGMVGWWLVGGGGGGVRVAVNCVWVVMFAP